VADNRQPEQRQHRDDAPLVLLGGAVERTTIVLRPPLGVLSLPTSSDG
jgi:hypothetical protein